MKIDSSIVDSICDQLRSCRICKDLDRTGALCIDEKQNGLFYVYPKNVPINVMFIAESPPKPGNGFFYDEQTRFPRFRNKVFKLLNCAGLGPMNFLQEFNDKGFYLTDAMNCRWNKDNKKDLPIQVFRNCSVYLEKQLKLFMPRFIVAMGNKAKKSLTYHNIEDTIKELEIPERNIIRMSFPLRAVNETDEERVNKLKRLAKLLERTGSHLK